MITVKNVSHAFRIGKKGKEKKIDVLKDIDFKVNDGEIVSIVGKSGSGKSTFLHMLASFMKPDRGEIHVNGVEIASFNEVKSAKFRLENFGFIFQNFQLMPGLNTFENIELPLKLQGMDQAKRKEKVERMMKEIGLDHVADHYPNELSGGQQQRVSIARALITDPPIILADEPTGSLDSETEQDVLLLIQTLNRKRGISFVMITHDDEVARIADRVYTMHDGYLTEGAAQYAI
ncbi:MAG TPA: ABC transporter ATP-binding protein [Pseudogracilibacillus sp.]|nr:ABC transporter ATP-binding protein [Pseudogracilibacillus sp.]